MPDYWGTRLRKLLQHWTVSSIIPTSRRRVSLEEHESPKRRTVSFAEDRSLTWSTSTSGSLEPTILSRHYADLFTVALRNENIQEFDSKWDEILLSMTQNPIWWHLGKLVQIKNTRVWETQDRIGIVQLTWLSQIEDNCKRSISRIYVIGILKPETEIMKETPWSRIWRQQKQRGQRIFGDCWQWEAKGQCSKGDNCSFRHDVNKRAKMTQPNPSPNSFMQQNERNASRTRSPRGRSPSGRMARLPYKGLPQRNLHQSILWKIASSGVLGLQVREWMQIWEEVLLCASPGWRTASQEV